MNTAEVRNKIFETVNEKADLLGTWRLTVDLTSRLGVGGFTAKLLDSYIDPITGKQRHYYDENGIQQAGFMITKPIMTFEPRVSRQEAHAVDFLLGHPIVVVEENHGNLDEKYVAKKQNSQFKLVNLDHRDLSGMENQNVIDKLIGRLSYDTGNHSIGIEKLRVILASLNMGYRHDKHLMGSNSEKEILRTRVKNYVREGQDSSRAQEVNTILDQMDEFKYIYQIKELDRFDIIDNSSGIYKYEHHPIGATIESVISYFKKNPDFYGELMVKLSAKHKIEQKNLNSVKDGVKIKD